ncbi:hypothetical protein [Nocardia ninae]|uniref:hypothetical protein n=1 Tax=Nocardia ninae TaxID=356145 RepID=UPI001649FB62|nr:hypothetical protein [Nocardia ninae]
MVLVTMTPTPSAPAAALPPKVKKAAAAAATTVRPMAHSAWVIEDSMFPRTWTVPA